MPLPITVHNRLVIFTLWYALFLYGSECWELRKTDERQILELEMDRLRKTLGVSRLQKLRNGRNMEQFKSIQKDV